jgi:hypothetical protein
MKRFLLVTTTVASALVLAAPSLAAGSLPTMTISLHGGKSIAVGGAETSGAVTIKTTVHGEASGEPTLFQLKPGVSDAAFFKGLKALSGDTPFDAIDPYASAVFDAVSPSGTSSAETVLAPGRYVALDLSSQGKPPAAEFTVKKSAHAAKLPKPGATVTAIDFAFRGASALHDGELVRFQNDGYLVHMFLFAQAKSAADASKAEADLLQGNIGAAKQYTTGLSGQFAGPLSTGGMQQEVITQPPGVYVVLCLMNAEDGRDHYQLGMFRTITIAK